MTRPRRKPDLILIPRDGHVNEFWFEEMLASNMVESYSTGDVWHALTDMVVFDDGILRPKGIPGQFTSDVQEAYQRWLAEKQILRGGGDDDTT